MLKTIILTLLFSILVSFVIGIITFVLGYMLYYIISEIVFYGWFEIVPSPKTFYVTYSVIGLIISLIASCVAGYLLYEYYYAFQNGNDEKWFTGWDECGESVTFGKAVACNIAVLIIGVASFIALICLYKYATNEILTTEDGLVPTHILALIFFLVGIGTGMIVYFIVLCVGYNESACSCCRLIGTISFSLVSSETKSFTEYRTKTDREKIGSIYSNDIEFAEVYGDIKLTQSRDIQETTNRYKGKCCACGHINHRTAINSVSDLWK